MGTKTHSGNSERHKVPAPDTSSDGSTEPLDRNYGDEHGGYMVEPTDDEPRRPVNGGSTTPSPSSEKRGTPNRPGAIP